LGDVSVSKIIAEGVDARGQPYKLIHYKGGCKYLWGENGRETVWERFDNSCLSEKETE